MSPAETAEVVLEVLELASMVAPPLILKLSILGLPSTLSEWDNPPMPELLSPEAAASQTCGGESQALDGGVSPHGQLDTLSSSSVLVKSSRPEAAQVLLLEFHQHISSFANLPPKLYQDA